MDNNLFQRLKELVEANQQIGIILPANPSFDTVAGGLGMYLALAQMKKQVTIVCPTDITVGVSSLVGIDKIQKSFGAGGGNDLIVSFPYKDGEIEKVSYNVDNGKLQIVVKAGPQGLSFTQSDVQFQRGGDGGIGTLPALLFFIGVADSNAIGFTKQPGTTVVNIDNRSQNTKFGDVVHVDSRFSSISEEIADFLTLLEPQIELDVDTSQDLLSGILSATDNFQNGKGSYLAFEMAGILMKKGAVRSASGAYANPTTTSMPTTNYFPPQSVAQPEPVQPAPAPVPTPNFGSMFGAQPVQQPEPVQPQQNAQPFGSAQGQPPADWLTPKVYKGSTVL